MSLTERRWLIRARRELRSQLKGLLNFNSLEAIAIRRNILKQIRMVEIAISS